MATKSILKKVVISDKKLANTFVNALTDSHDAKFKVVPLSRETKTLKGEAVKDFFSSMK